MEEVRVGSKSTGAYVSAVLYAFKQNSRESVVVAGLGSQVSKTFDIAEEAVDVLDVASEADTEYFELEGLQGVRITLTKEGCK